MVYMALCTDDPGNGQTVNHEASGALYTRQPVTYNHQSVTFNVDSGTYTHFALCGDRRDSQIDHAEFGSPVHMSGSGQVVVTCNVGDIYWEQLNRTLTWEQTWDAYVGAMLEGETERAAFLLAELTAGHRVVRVPTTFTQSATKNSGRRKLKEALKAMMR